ncbi:MAG: hypothetical protein ACYTAF_09800 [Planctomycetota bacterium]|jgi:hypothetical protein
MEFTDLRSKDVPGKDPVQEGMEALEWAVRELQSLVEAAREEEIKKINAAWFKVWGEEKDSGPEDKAFVERVRAQPEYQTEIEGLGRKYQKVHQRMDVLRDLGRRIKAMEEKAKVARRDDARRMKGESALKDQQVMASMSLAQKEKQLREQEAQIKQLIADYETQRTQIDAEWAQLAEKQEKMMQDAQKELGDRLLAHHKETRLDTERHYEVAVKRILTAFDEASQGLERKAKEELAKLSGVMQVSEKEAGNLVRGFFTDVQETEGKQAQKKGRGKAKKKPGKLPRVTDETGPIEFPSEVGDTDIIQD